MSLEPPAPQDVVVVGASGDLSRRKLLPALYNLAAAGLLPRRGSIIGLAPSAYKPIEQVIKDSEDLVETVAILSQFINYKGL